MRPHLPSLLLLALTAAGLAACGGSGSSPEVVADFQLLDVNPNSPTYGDPVSPRAHMGHVTAWYFGEAT